MQLLSNQKLPNPMITILFTLTIPSILNTDLTVTRRLLLMMRITNILILSLPLMKLARTNVPTFNSLLFTHHLNAVAALMITTIYQAVL